MGRKKSQEEVKAGAPEWMATFSDLMTLLLCFFVLLFAFSTIDQRKFTAVMKSFTGSAGVLSGGKTIDPDQYINDKALDKDKVTKQLEEMEDFKKLKDELEVFLEENKMQDNILVDLDARGLLLRFKDNVLFDSGYARLKPTSTQSLRFLADLLKQNEFLEKHIRVEGHTDGDPIRRSNKFATNWELSVTRASNVVRFFIEETGIKPDRLSASGYAEYHPVAPNDTKENKAKNRRVDVVILRSALSNVEPGY